ncbi:3-deoxy-D-manno-octulosonic acid transferase [Parasulfuritortus cantonensis]|uniref:3-deoxy-D-manno-octulosonic acid transferase n=1 Tax=Parasulfuritortus cantonensis TaxID=2528202 RepID=A0A4R1B8Y9_9PROT|nr:lipid IV(A) 3-deoxy-D-manno-octulosonic acid transferase [Parasulfuritortus cantonensis]TCJ12933.1 3-deoxy-D-manno-octulosonic acid transferase [Parasulfuritortus cantonensis]
MRALYTLLWLLALPFMFVYLRWRGRRQPEYRTHWRERLGWGPALPDGPVIWLHTVSVGETRAAAPLMRALRRRRPDATILLSHTTPTGRATARELFGADIPQTYLPYDLPGAVNRFLERGHPGIAIFLETEVWPNLYAACAGRAIPTYLVNARLSEKSARGYGRIAGLIRPALASLAGCAAQTEADAGRLAGLGAGTPLVTGNMKFDVTAPADTYTRAEELRRRFAGRFVFVAASTRDGEEALLLDTCLGLDIADLLLVIVPRHPQRFDEVAALLESRGVEFARRSRGDTVTRETEVFLGDSMGELAAYYAAADAAFIGGSLLPLGGQNLIEAADMGCPVLIGPHTWNFLDATERAIAEGAALRVADAEDLARALKRLHRDADKRHAMAEAGIHFSRAHKGATEKVMALLEPVLARLA